MSKRVQIKTTLYGTRLVSVAQLYQLHREVATAASKARQSDPNYLSRVQAGRAAAGL